MKFHIFLILLLLLGPIFAEAGDIKNENGSDLILQTESKINLFALPSFEMKADVQLDNQGKPLDGLYALYWAGPDQWREEITFPGYSEVQVGGKGVVFTKRRPDFVPLRIGQLRGTLGYGSSPESGLLFHHALRPDETAMKLHDRKVDGKQVLCVEIVDHQKHKRSACIDRTNGIPFRGDPFQDGDVEPIGPNLFPRSLAWIEKGKRLVDIRIKQLQPMKQPQPGLFDPPQGATAKPGCMNPMPWRRTSYVVPKYPEQDRTAYVEGTVALFTLIGTDGIPKSIKVVSSVTPTLNEASLSAVKQWRYEPASCDGKPVETETLIEVNFSLQR